MRHHLNTIYVTSESGWIRKDGANLIVEVEGVERGRAPIHMVGGIVSFGRAGASPAAMAACAEAGVAMSFLAPNGRFIARLEGARTGNVQLRRTQYRVADDPARALPIIRGIVAAKCANQRSVIRHAIRDHGADFDLEARFALETAERRFTDLARRIVLASDAATLRGIEGEAGQTYWSVFDALIRVDDPALRFGGRSRRPPRDRINALLSFLYANLGHDCRAALETVGLDPQVGLLHADRPGRASLALDLMEEFRPVLADRLALDLVARRQIAAADFIVDGSSAVSLTDDARRRVLDAWQERKRDELRHPYLGEPVSLGLAPHVQALLLARHLGGELDDYPAFVWT